MAMATTTSMVEGMTPLALPSPSPSPISTFNSSSAEDGVVVQPVHAGIPVITYPHPYPPLTVEATLGHPPGLEMEDLGWLGDDACDDPRPNRVAVSMDDVFHPDGRAVRGHGKRDTTQPKTIAGLSDGGSNDFASDMAAHIGPKTHARNKTADVAALHSIATNGRIIKRQVKAAKHYSP
jgi:hypothetical protein